MTHVAADVTRHDGAPPDRDWYDRWFAQRGLSPSWWSNEPGHRYAVHEHGYRKVLFCTRGEITFHVGDVGDRDREDVRLTAGDRLEVPPGTPHSATVGADGVQCVEAAVGDQVAGR